MIDLREEKVYVLRLRLDLQELGGGKDKSATNEQLLNAKRMALSHLPRIIASLSALWQAVLVTKDK